MTQEILPILNELSKTSKTLEKHYILQKYKDNVLLQQVIYSTLTPYDRYYIKETSFPKYHHNKDNKDNGITLEDGLEKIKKLSTREITGSMAIDYLKNILESLSEDNAEVIKRVVLKDLKCGISDKSVNKIWDNLIPEVPYMRCSGADKMKNIIFPAIIQEKEDGSFANIIVKNGVVKFLTRNGTDFCIDNIAALMLDNLPLVDNKVFIGEMLVKVDGVIAERKIGNGMLNRIMKYDSVLENLIASKTKDKQEKIDTLIQEMVELQSNVFIKLWDVVPVVEWEQGYYDEKYSDRFSTLKDICKQINSPKFSTVLSTFVYSTEEAVSFNSARMKEGKEGSVIKNSSTIFKSGTSTNQVKMKAILDADLICTGWNKGTEGTSFDIGIGGLNLESSDGKIKVTVGSGLSREQRGLEPKDKNDIAKGLKKIKGFNFDQYTGKIITIEYNALIKSDSNDTYSLFLPVFIEVREDKTEADSFEKLSLQG